ncbi:hypothetical protein CSUB01_12060 [Colletotrichum sublineola]|uniref:Uncharacterized protein n=1 Tax=Colletotrichum sublineola TaxID=1173701 RepID=A0A066Y0J4_COLSU|nr:hypothetical protein CSUB01_12060 [Colletotrichum sublineola]
MATHHYDHNDIVNALLALCRLQHPPSRNPISQVDESTSKPLNDATTPFLMPAKGPEDATTTRSNTHKIVEALGSSLDGEGHTGTNDRSDLQIPSRSWQLNRIKCHTQTFGASSCHWVSDAKNKRSKHQLLANDNDYNPGNFAVAAADICSILYAEGTNTIEFLFWDGYNKPKEDLFLEFDKIETKADFLAFCGQQNIHLYRTEP